MIKNALLLMNLTFLALLLGCASKERQGDDTVTGTRKIIFETDMGNDVDDALALDMLYKYLDAGEIDLLGIMLNKEGESPVIFTDIMNNWYGYPAIPIGVVREGADSEHDAVNYARCVALLENDKGEPMFDHSHIEYPELPEAHDLYRELLAGQPDSSVVIVSVGFSTNLARLLDTPPDEFSPLTGKELVAKKVKYLSNMAGCFNVPEQHEYNIIKDISAAQKVYEEWPTAIITSPFEVGIQVNYPATSIEEDFNWAPEHPLVEAYKCYLEMPYDRPTWDLTSVLYAVEGASYFDISSRGYISVTDEGYTSFKNDRNGNHQYLMIDSLQAENIKHRFVDLISTSPKNRVD